MSYAAIADARGVKPGSGLSGCASTTSCPLLPNHSAKRRPAHRSTKNLTALSSADFFFVADTFYEAHDADVPSETVIMIDAAVYWSDPTTTRGLGKFAWDLEITGAE